MLRDMVDDARRCGFAFNPGLIVSAMQAVAVPVMGANGQPIAALSIAAINERMVPERLAAAISLLGLEGRRMEEALRQRKPVAAASALERRRKR